MPFRRIGLDQRDELGPLLDKNPQKLSGYTFAMLAAWDPMFCFSWAQPEPDVVLVSSWSEERRDPMPDPHLHLLQPMGRLSPQLQRRIVSEAAKLPYPLKIDASKEFVDANPEIVAHFDVEEDRDMSNYIYAAKDQALLPGNKLMAKRKMIARASREYPWTAQELTRGDASECIALARHLLEEEDRPASQELPTSRKGDVIACEIALKNLELLSLRGTVIRVEGRIVAFSLWEPMNEVTAVVHFSRAVKAYRGLYQVISREVAKTIHAEGFELINREEDLGDPGLRGAKLSYRPVRIEPAYTLTYRGNGA